MSLRTRVLNIVYSSDLQIDDPELLTTLSVFYDKVYLPYPYNCDPDAEPLIGMMNILKREVLLEEEDVGGYISWKNRHKVLFDSGTFELLPPSVNRNSPNWTEQQEKQLLRILGAAYGDEEKRLAPAKPKNFRNLMARAVHAALTKKPCAEFFGTNSTSALAGLIVHPLFRYKLPRLGELSGDQILELRNLVKDSREGFIDYIFELTDDLESRLKGDNHAQLDTAGKLVERRLLPRYNEYRRQLDSNNAKFGSKLLALGAKAMQIDASPLTPKFYGQLYEILFNALGGAAAVDAKHKTNASQAFQYISKLERYSEATE